MHEQPLGGPLASLPSCETLCDITPAAVHVCVFAFDLLYRDGASLAHLPLSERRRQLRDAFPAMQPGFFNVAEGVEFAAAAAKPMPAPACVVPASAR